MKNSDYIKKARLELGLSQKKLSEELGFSQNTISEWENGVYEPKKIVIRAITLMLAHKRNNDV